MRKWTLAAGLLLIASTAFAAESIKVTVGHMCCGACKAAAMEGLKKLEWAEGSVISETTVTVTAKADQKVEVISLLDALNKAGFPARQIDSSGPITLTLAHLCCDGCANDLQTKIGEFRSAQLDKGNVKIDKTARTVTLQPQAGMTLNVVAMIRLMERAGFSASRCTLAPAAAAIASRRAPRAAASAR